MRIKSIPTGLILLFSALLFSQCAKMVAPTGGPKDEDPPLIVKIDPPFNTTNFDRKKINITFNEFIQLKDLNSNLVVSPPMEEKPEVTVKGKTLEIELLDELQDSVTYNIYFGNSVQDYNEGNPIENFEYVFSTGDYIDSLSIKGQVLNSFNLMPEEGVFVMLYKDYEDSVPMKQLPVHISKTNKDGFFQINNISNNKFKMFCLRDFNKNYLFDLPNEDIAFTDSLLTFSLVTETTVDTIYKSDSTAMLMDSTYNIKSSEVNLKSFERDSLLEQSDSLKNNEQKEIDTIIVNSRTFFPVQDFVFRLFTEYHEVQYLKNNSRNTKQKIELIFNKPIKDSITFSIADTTIQHDWFLKEANQHNDSIIYWLTDSTLYNKKNLNFALSYYKEDTNMIYQWSTDTLKLRYTESKQNKNEEADTSLKYTLNVKGRGTLDLNKPINFSFETPIQQLDTSKIDLYAVIDTIEIPVEYNLIQDSLKLREYKMSVDWSADTIYRMELYPDAFKDIYETANDTNIFEFKTQKRDYYGKLLANITGIDSAATSFQVITQLVIPSKDEEKVIKEKIIKNDQIVEFDYLPPKELLFKVIIDKNFNGKWDTGEYLEHIQPEEVLYYKDKIKVRSNWDIEISFDVNKK